MCQVQVQWEQMLYMRCDKAGTQWKAQYNCIVLHTFHFLSPPAGAIGRHSSGGGKAPLKVGRLSIFAYYTKISVVKNCSTAARIKK